MLSLGRPTVGNIIQELGLRGWGEAVIKLNRMLIEMS